MTASQEIYMEAIRKKVCGVCLDYNSSDACDIAKENKCAIERFLPEIIETATSVTSDKIDDYVSALRASVCRACRPNGEIECSVRDSAECILDRYFVLIIEAVEEVVLRDKQRDVSFTN